jgi:hypothetical protein
LTRGLQRPQKRERKYGYRYEKENTRRKEGEREKGSIYFESEGEGGEMKR